MTNNKRHIRWTSRAAGYYEGVAGGSGLPLVLAQNPITAEWSLYAGDRTDARATAKTLKKIKEIADRLFC